jgi:hypothetical protein
MKKLILTTFLAMSMCLSIMAQTATITLEWDASPPGENVTKFSLYHSLTSGTNYALAGETLDGVTLTLDHSINVDGLTHYWVLTATNEFGESGYSNEASVTAASPGTTILRITGISAAP